MKNFKYGDKVTATTFDGRTVTGTVETVAWFFENVMFYAVRLPADPAYPYKPNTVNIYPERDPIALAA